MPPKTRQQRRARSRSPVQKRRRGAVGFLAFTLIVLFGGIGLIFLARANPPPLTRGASIGEHWHASYKIFICGKRMTNFPTVEGELHSHGDGFMHIHPSTAAAAGDLASVSTFLRLYQTSLGLDAKGKRELSFPDGTSYTDGDRCPKGTSGPRNKRYDIVMTNKGKTVKGDPGAFLPHNGDAVEIVFGPKGNKPMPNPYSVVNHIPDVGHGGATPAPDSGPASQPGTGTVPKATTSDSKKKKK
jgi:hypothetical protein